MKTIIKFIKNKSEKTLHAKEGTSTALQYRAMITLLVFALFTFLLSILSEFERINLTYHQEYFTNLCLGIAASALISFMAILVPFLIEKNETKKRFEILAKKVFINLHFLMYKEPLENVNQECESIKLLTKSIIDFNNFFESISFSSKYFDKIAKQINKNVPKLVSRFKSECEILDKNFIQIHSKDVFGEEEYEEVINRTRNYILDIFKKEFSFPIEISEYDISRELEYRIFLAQEPLFENIDDVIDSLFIGMLTKEITHITFEVSANKMKKLCSGENEPQE